MLEVGTTVRHLPGTALRVRRGARRDAPRVIGLLGARTDERACRRLLGGLGTDVYLAEDTAGALVGLVAVAYARSLVRGGLVAVLDGVRAAAAPSSPLVDGLVALAEERARRRGCRRLAAWVEPEDVALVAALRARGYREGAVFERDLA
jgi:hypothetical protein